ncbi:AcrVA2 family anti-CRISPR protein [Vibrio diabolicus]|uniref:AcrVA2 family anti-CRISPR protein n=1 Tax=Vibrio diabolicus TaxID=50719 RepID=UPI003B59DD1C
MNMRPSHHLNTISKQYPGIWKHVEHFRKGKGKDLGDWPDWCFLPMAASCAIAGSGGGLSFSPGTDISSISALIAWRYTQGIYCFEPEVYADIAKTVVDKEIPADVLYRLPEWGVYVELQDVEGVCGFFAHLEFDVKTKSSELRLLLDTEEMLTPIILHLGDWGVEEAINKSLDVSCSNAPWLSGIRSELLEWQSKMARKCLSLLLYICSEEPDIERVEGNLPTYAKPEKVKKGYKFFAPKKPKIWNVGKKIAHAVSSTSFDWKGGTHANPKAHIRRAHWHGYWTGQRNSVDRKFIYKWIPTMIVNSK